MSNGSSRVLELVVGLFVCLGVAAAFFLTFWVSEVNTGVGASYNITADFKNLGGVKVGTKVSASGVTIGRVTNVELLNEETTDGKVLFISDKARITMNIEGSYKLPLDVEAHILTAGLLGEKYVGMEGGGADDDAMPEDGTGVVKKAVSAVVLEHLISSLLASMTDGDDKDKDKK